VTLLETVVALVIVSLAAVGFLNVIEKDSTLPAASREWSEAVAYAEEGMELAKVGQPVAGQSRTGMTRRLERYRFAPKVQELRVVVRFTDGKLFELRRLAGTP
jgi:hypothetical protein